DRLEDKGWIKRERGREDRRIVFVTATDAGVQLVQDTPSPLQKKLADALNALPALEQATITMSLERIVHLMESTSAVEPEAPSDPSSPILDVPVADGAQPEPGIVVCWGFCFTLVLLWSGGEALERVHVICQEAVPCTRLRAVNIYSVRQGCRFQPGRRCWAGVS